MATKITMNVSNNKVELKPKDVILDTKRDILYMIIKENKEFLLVNLLTGILEYAHSNVTNMLEDNDILEWKLLNAEIILTD